MAVPADEQRGALQRKKNKTKEQRNPSRFFFAFQKATLPVARLAPIPQAFFRFDRRSLVLTQKRRPISNQGLAVHFFICGENFEKKPNNKKNPPRSPWKVITAKRPRTGAQQKTKKKRRDQETSTTEKKFHSSSHRNEENTSDAFFFFCFNANPAGPSRLDDSS